MDVEGWKTHPRGAIECNFQMPWSVTSTLRLDEMLHKREQCQRSNKNTLSHRLTPSAWVWNVLKAPLGVVNMHGEGEAVIIQGITTALCVYVVGGCWETSQSHTSLSVFVPLSAITLNTDIFFLFLFFFFLSKPRHSGGGLFLDCPDKWGVSYIWMWSRGEEEWKCRRGKKKEKELKKKKCWQNHKSF